MDEYVSNMMAPKRYEVAEDTERKEFRELCNSLALLHYAKYPEGIYERVGKWFCDRPVVTCKALREYAKQKKYKFK